MFFLYLLKRQIVLFSRLSLGLGIYSYYSVLFLRYFVHVFARYCGQFNQGWPTWTSTAGKRLVLTLALTTKA